MKSSIGDILSAQGSQSDIRQGEQAQLDMHCMKNCAKSIELNAA